MVNKLKIGILSYCDHLRTNAHINHQFYSNTNGYTYIFDISPTKHSRFQSKIDKILKFLPLFDYVFWIDDDAIFCNFEKKLEEFIKISEKSHFIFCKSPINQHGNWTYISSGNFFIKNTIEARSILEQSLRINLTVIKDWWVKEKLGLFTNGDQDQIIYMLHQFNIDYERLDYDQFNTRKYHFDENKPIFQHFLCHFVEGNKHLQLLDFAKRFGLNEFLIPEDIDKNYKYYIKNNKLKKVIRQIRKAKIIIYNCFNHVISSLRFKL